MNDLYTEIILDYFKHPKNKGPLPTATHSATEHNPTCGDVATVHLEIDPADPQQTIKKAVFEGQGCAISQAATAMFLETLPGKTYDELNATDNQQIYNLLQVPISPGRVKCALLGLIAAKNATRQPLSSL